MVGWHEFLVDFIINVLYRDLGVAYHTHIACEPVLSATADQSIVLC